MPQYCCGLGICNVPCALFCMDRTFCNHCHSPPLTEMGLQYLQGFSAPRGCEQSLQTGHASLCPLIAGSPLPSREPERLQRSSAHLVLGLNPLGMGKADSALVLLGFSTGSKACGNNSSSSFPRGIRLAGKLSEILLIACSDCSIVSAMLQYLFFFLN